MVKWLVFIHNWCKRLMKIARSYYYFGKGTVYVHGRIDIGRRRNIKIGNYCSVNRGVHIQGFSDVRIGSWVVLSPYCMILDGNLDHKNLVRTGKRDHIAGCVEIGDYVWVGAGAIILPGTSIGPRSIIAAGSVVAESFPEDVLVAGNPARVVKKLN